MTTEGTDEHVETETELRARLFDNLRSWGIDPDTWDGRLPEIRQQPLGDLPTTPSRLIRSARDKLVKATSVCDGIDCDVTGARGAVEYILSLTDALIGDLRAALAHDGKSYLFR